MTARPTDDFKKTAAPPLHEQPLESPYARDRRLNKNAEPDTSKRETGFMLPGNKKTGEISSGDPVRVNKYWFFDNRWYSAYQAKEKPKIDKALDKIIAQGLGKGWSQMFVHADSWYADDGTLARALNGRIAELKNDPAIRQKFVNEFKMDPQAATAGLNGMTCAAEASRKAHEEMTKTAATKSGAARGATAPAA